MSSSSRLISTTFAYSASSSASNAVHGRLTRSARYALQTSSTGKMPFFAPASIAMFAMVRRPSMPISFTPSPVNSSD